VGINALAKLGEPTSLVYVTLNLNVSAPWQNFKNLEKNIDKQLLYPMHQFLLSRIKTLGGDVRDRQTDRQTYRVKTQYKNTKLRCLLYLLK